MGKRLRNIVLGSMTVIAIGGVSAMFVLGIWTGISQPKKENIYDFNYYGNPANIIKRTEGPFRSYYFSIAEDSLKGSLVTDEGDTIRIIDGDYGDLLYINSNRIR